MQWQDQGTVLAVRQFSESSRIVTVFARSVGKTSGLVKSVKTSIQLGDVCDVTWRGRNLESLGTFKIETLFSPFAFIFDNPKELLALESACSLCLNGLPERAPHQMLFDELKTLFFNITQENWLADYVIFEKDFLAEMGMGLSLSKCAVTGQKTGLKYVSPRTGRAVTQEVGEKYKNRLFSLPEFLFNESEKNPSVDEIFLGLDMTGHFLRMYFNSVNDKSLPLSRNYLIEALRSGIV
ncbi:MAG: DNA repair protein RecO [Alphaproteobacteria bacterium]|nr:DNA repair protein RecO [Alphaproteobacteria bacterium]